MQEFVGRLQPALEIFAAYPYLMLFIGLLLVGEMVLLPALYLAATGRLDALLVIAVAIFAGMLSDFLWYLLGRWYPARAVKKISRRLPAERLDRFEQLFARNGAALLFVSKFVYGTRIVAQVLAANPDQVEQYRAGWLGESMVQRSCPSRPNRPECGNNQQDVGTWGQGQLSILEILEVFYQVFGDRCRACEIAGGRVKVRILN